MLLAAMPMRLVVGLAQARLNHASEAFPPPSSDLNGLDQSPTFMRHDPIGGGNPQGYDPIIWGVWILMKSFGGGN